MRRVLTSLLLLTLLAMALYAVTPPPVLNPSLRDIVRAPSTYVNAYALSANTAKTVTVPTFSGPGVGAQTSIVAVFSATCSNYYVRSGGTASAPGGDVDGYFAPDTDASTDEDGD